jgi:hypothetical protein
MNIQFCVVINKKEETILANGYEYDPGYSYSEYTRQDPSTSVNSVFTSLNNIFGPRYDCDGYTPILFENKEVAENWIKDRFYNDEAREQLKVLSFAEFDEIAEKMLLDK